MAETPRWTLDDTLHRARTAQRLAGKYSAQVEPRLSPGLTDRLRTSIFRLTSFFFPVLDGQHGARLAPGRADEGASAGTVGGLGGRRHAGRRATRCRTALRRHLAGSR